MQTLSPHAEARIRQRGIRSGALALILERFDTAIFVGSGLVSASISRSAAAGLVAEGFSPNAVDAAKDISVLFDESTGEIVTVLHTVGTPGKRYRRQLPTRKN